MSIAHQIEAPAPGPVVLYGVTWDSYDALVKLFEDRVPALRLTYLKGTLEIMATSREHEELKTLIARLLEIWAFHKDVRINGYGSATFRKEAAERGLEPDECYVLGQLVEVPEIAIEIVKSRAAINKLDVYAGLGVKEVWIWDAGRLAVHRLVGDEYEQADSSALLPELDVAQLSSFVRVGADQSDVVRAYSDALKQS